MLKREGDAVGKIKITCNIKKKKSTAEALIIHYNVCMQEEIYKNTLSISGRTSSWVCAESGVGLLDTDLEGLLQMHDAGSGSC